MMVFRGNNLKGTLVDELESEKKIIKGQIEIDLKSTTIWHPLYTVLIDPSSYSYVVSQTET